MKKSIVFILGASLFSGAILLPSFASKEAYHAYLISKKATDKGYRTFSEGRGNHLKERLRRKKVEAQLNRSTYRGQNLRYSQTNTRDTYRRSDVNLALKMRASTDAIRSNSNNSQPRKAVVALHIRDQDVHVATYENEAFSVQIPKGWKNSSKAIHTFKNSENDFVVNIKTFPTETCNNLQGFNTCAIAISRNENRKAISGDGELISSSRIVRQSQKLDTFLNRPNLRTNTFTESFSAYVPGRGERLINRYFVANLDGGVYLVETSSSVHKAKDNIKVSKAIFDSFRIYPQE